MNISTNSILLSWKILAGFPDKSEKLMYRFRCKVTIINSLSLSSTPCHSLNTTFLATILHPVIRPQYPFAHIMDPYIIDDNSSRLQSHQLLINFGLACIK